MGIVGYCVNCGAPIYFYTFWYGIDQRERIKDSCKCFLAQTNYVITNTPNTNSGGLKWVI